MPYTILVAEDDTTINEVVSEYLKDAGYTVIPVLSGNAARDVIEKSGNINLFILDIMLPGLTGLELLKEIRIDERFKLTPVIMLTALTDEYTQLISFNGQADDYVTKPFSPKVLVKRVEALLRRTNGAGLTLCAGKVTINTDSYEAYEDGERLSLTLKEFELLKTLINNEKKVLTRQQLLNYAWGYDYFGDERIVDVHIKNLRKKFKTDIITTVKGVGYKIEISETEADKNV